MAELEALEARQRLRVTFRAALRGVMVGTMHWQVFGVCFAFLVLEFLYGRRLVHMFAFEHEQEERARYIRETCAALQVDSWNKPYTS